MKIKRGPAFPAWGFALFRAVLDERALPKGLDSLDSTTASITAHYAGMQRAYHSPTLIFAGPPPLIGCTARQCNSGNSPKGDHVTTYIGNTLQPEEPE